MGRYNIDEKIDDGHRGQFLQDCIKEAGVTEVEGWDHTHPNKEFFRYTNWVRRLIEECNWWELNGGAKNINGHLQVRLMGIYEDIVNRGQLPDELVVKLRMPSNVGVEPSQEDWEEWYTKRAREADLWYRHWCSHIGSVKGAGFGNYANSRLMKIRNTWQLFKNKRSYTPIP